MNTQLSLEDISKWSGVSEKRLQEVYDRGVGAHRTNPGSVRLKGSFRKDPRAPVFRRLSKEQWAYARVYAFLDKLEDPGESLNHDKDVAKGIQVRLSGSVLGRHGYQARLSSRERQAAIRKAIEAGESPLRIFRRLNVLMIYNKKRRPGLASKFRSDRDYVSKRFLSWKTRTKYGVPVTFKYTKGPRVQVAKLNRTKTDAEVIALARKEHRRSRSGVPMDRWIREALQNYSTFQNSD
jgi:hypothetical protein